ncbi:hypothetical protein P40081_22240 [Paenibacillus sp. FSL P4-0081]|nr:hypothetical protein P40081_22240 [Paenibacillus sp. FSL P4-0081]OMF30153.1 hypothetical protein BK132_08250 [Paenibacillus sp. FSL H8-0259]
MNYVANLVVQDGNTNSLYFIPGWRILSSRTAAVNADEHRIALRIGWIDTNGNGKVDFLTSMVLVEIMLIIILCFKIAQEPGLKNTVQIHHKILELLIQVILSGAMVSTIIFITVLRFILLPRFTNI